MMRRRSLIRIDDSNSCRRRVVGGLDRWRLHRTSDGFDENRRRDLERLCDAAPRGRDGAPSMRAMSQVDKETSARRDSTIPAAARCDAAAVTRPKTSWRKARILPRTVGEWGAKRLIVEM